MSEREPLPSPMAKVPQPGTPGPVPANGISVNDGAKSMLVDAAKAAPSGGRDFLRRRRLVVVTIGVLALGSALWFGIPWIRFALLRPVFTVRFPVFLWMTTTA